MVYSTSVLIYIVLLEDFDTGPVILIQSLLFWYSPCYFDAVPVILMQSLLFWYSPCYFDTVPVILIQSLLFWYSPCYFDAVPVILMQSLLFWCSPCYFDAVPVILMQSLLFWYSPCYFDAVPVIFPSLLYVLALIHLSIPADLCDILIWYYSVTPISFSFLTLNLSTSKSCVAHFWQSLSP